MGTLGRRNYQTVRTLLSMHENGELILRPDFQRNFVWLVATRSLLIDSVLQDYPMPLIMLKDESVGTKQRLIVVDGQQRLTTLLAFVSPNSFPDEVRFKLTPSHAKRHGGSTFDELTVEQQEAILSYELTIFSVPITTSGGTVLDIFSRLNTRGTKLNKQEDRNSKYAGAFKQYAYRVATSNNSTWEVLKLFDQQQLLRMEDAQLVSDLTYFMLEGTKALSQPALGKLYARYDESFPFEDVAVERFSFVLTQIVRVLERQNDSIFEQKTWFYALFCHVYNYAYEGKLLSQYAEGRPMPESWHDVPSKLRSKLADGSKESASATQTVRTTNKDSRKLRNKVLGEAIYGAEWGVPDIL